MDCILKSLDLIVQVVDSTQAGRCTNVYKLLKYHVPKTECYKGSFVQGSTNVELSG